MPDHSVFGETGYIALDRCQTLMTEEESVDFCFGALNDPHHCARRKILSVTNVNVDAFNKIVLDRLTSVYLLPEYFKCSADSLEHDHDEQHIHAHLTSELWNKNKTAAFITE